MMARDKSAFQIGDRVYFRKKQPGKWDLKWRPRYRIVCTEHDRHFIHTENRPLEKYELAKLQTSSQNHQQNSGM